MFNVTYIEYFNRDSVPTIKVHAVEADTYETNADFATFQSIHGSRVFSVRSNHVLLIEKVK